MSWGNPCPIGHTLLVGMGGNLWIPADTISAKPPYHANRALNPVRESSWFLAVLPCGQHIQPTVHIRELETLEAPLDVPRKKK